MMESSPFLHFAQAAERIGATTKRLEKASILGEYFAGLNDADLCLASRYFAGYLFSLRDQRTANVGGAALYRAIVAASGADENWLSTRYVQLGDAGDAAWEAWNESNHVIKKSQLLLENIADAIKELAAASGSKRKLELVTALLSRTPALEAKYIVKLLQGDLRIGLREGAVEDALARAAKVSVGEVQRCNMLLGDIGETALLARHDKLRTAQMKLFHPIKFMLASPAADLSDVARLMPEEFFVEDKFDGIRAQAHIGIHQEDSDLHGVEYSGRRVAVFSRTLDEITRSFPDLVGPLSELLGDNELQNENSGLILDGEIVPLRDGKIAPFQELQKRLGRKTLTPEILQDIPVAFVAYDVLFARRVLMETPGSERRSILQSLQFNHETTILAESKIFSDVAPLDDEFDAARARGNEGLMVKDPRAFYKPGRRGKEWLKIKRALATLDVVVTAVEVGNGRRNKFLSDYTFAVRASETDPTLLNVGKAYSGLTDKEIDEMSHWFREHTIQEFAHGKVRTVEPQIVIEITFDNIQKSARHKSGYALRFPRILRLRPDKPASEIDTLETVRRLAGDE